MTLEQKYEGKQGVGQDSWLYGCATCTVQQGATLGLMRCCCHLEILNKFFNRKHFHFILGPTNDVAGPGPAMNYVILGGRASQTDAL